MIRSKFLAVVYLDEKCLEHGGRLPLNHHALEVCAHVRVLVPGIRVPEVDDKLSVGAVGVA